jgi:hypothetical protein
MADIIIDDVDVPLGERCSPIFLLVFLSLIPLFDPRFPRTLIGVMLEEVVYHNWQEQVLDHSVSPEYEAAARYGVFRFIVGVYVNASQGFSS